MAEWDPFVGESGLREDWDGVIENAEFVQNDRGVYQLVLTFKVIGGDEDGEEQEIKLGIGKDWTSYDGEEVEGKSAKSRFNDRTAYMRFIKRAMEAGAKDELQKRSRSQYKGRGPMFASSWVGLMFHMDVVNFPGQRQVDGEWKDVEGGIPAMVPEKFLGVEKGQGTGTQVKETTGVQSGPFAPTATSPAPSTSGAGPNTTIHPADLAMLVEAAKEAADYQSFTDRVISLKSHDGTNMIANKDVMNALANEGWYNELKESK